MSGFLKKIFNSINKPDETGSGISKTGSSPGHLPLRVHSFHMLMSANARLWQLIPKAEHTLHSDKYFNIIYIRALATDICLRVFSILKNYQTICGTNQDASARFRELQASLESLVAEKKPQPGKKLTVHLSQAKDQTDNEIGSRMAGLVRAKTALPLANTPTGFIITSAGYQSFMRHNKLKEDISCILQSAEIKSMSDLFKISSEIQMRIIKSDLPEDLADAIMTAYRSLEMETGYRGVKTALLPSIDSEKHNFPLELLCRDKYNVGEELLLRAYKEVVAGRYSLTSMSHRLQKGLIEKDLPLCVGCLAMINTSFSGIMHTSNPFTPEASDVLIRAVPGMDVSLDQGCSEPDTWVVSRNEAEIIQKKIYTQNSKYVFFLSEEGLTRVNVSPGQASAQALNDQQVMELADLGLHLEKRLGYPLRISWILDNHDRFFIMESSAYSLVDNIHSAAIDKSRPSEILSKGLPVSKGKNSGHPYFASKHRDLLEFHEHGVLIIDQAHSRWAPLLPWANAILTEKPGDPFGRLAATARIFDVPAVFGVENITTKTRPDEPVSVNAYSGTVSKLGKMIIESETENFNRHPLADTPIHNTLRQVIRLVGDIENIYPSQVINPKKQNLSELAHFSHLSSTETLLELAFNHLPGASNFKIPKNSWLTWDLDEQSDAKLVPGSQLEQIDCRPLGIISARFKNTNSIHLDHKKEKSINRKIVTKLINPFSTQDSLFDHPANILFSKDFFHLSFSSKGIRIILQCYAREDSPENLIFFMLNTVKPVFYTQSSSLNNLFARVKFHTKLDNRSFIARKAGMNINNSIAFIDMLGLLLTQISPSEEPDVLLKPIKTRIDRACSKVESFIDSGRHAKFLSSLPVS